MGKKGGTGKKKSKKSKKGKEYLPLQYDIPAYEDPNFSSQVKLQIIMADPDIYCMQFPLEVPCNTLVEQIIQQIQQFHQGAINQIKLYMDRARKGPWLNPDSTLKSNKIYGNSEFTIYYDYNPIKAPILQ